MLNFFILFLLRIFVLCEVENFDVEQAGYDLRLVETSLSHPLLTITLHSDRFSALSRGLLSAVHVASYLICRNRVVLLPIVLLHALVSLLFVPPNVLYLVRFRGCQAH